MLRVQCLDRDPSTRLRASETRTCVWFRPLDFAALLCKRVPAPWLPPVADAADTSLVDPEFGTEPAVMTPETHNPANDAFEGFTYTEKTDLDD